MVQCLASGNLGGRANPGENPVKSVSTDNKSHHSVISHTMALRTSRPAGSPIRRKAVLDYSCFKCWGSSYRNAWMMDWADPLDRGRPISTSTHCSRGRRYVLMARQVSVCFQKKKNPGPNRKKPSARLVPGCKFYLIFFDKQHELLGETCLFRHKPQPLVYLPNSVPLHDTSLFSFFL